MTDDILKRLLTEQQAEIDKLRAELERSEKAHNAKDKSFAEYYDKRDKFFKHLNRLTSTSSFNHIDPATASRDEWGDWKHEVRMYMAENGWCLNCETTSCFGDCYE